MHRDNSITGLITYFTSDFSLYTLHTLPEFHYSHETIHSPHLTNSTIFKKINRRTSPRRVTTRETLTEQVREDLPDGDEGRGSILEIRATSFIAASRPLRLLAGRDGAQGQARGA